MTIYRKDSHRNDISVNSQKSKISDQKNELNRQNNDDNQDKLKKIKFQKNEINQNIDFENNLSEIRKNQMNQLDCIIEYNQNHQQDRINIDQIEDIYEREGEQNDLSFEQNKKKNSSILTNPKQNQSRSDKNDDDDQLSHQNKQKALGLLDQIQKNEQINTLPSKSNLDQKSNNKKSDLEFFLQKGPDYFYAEQIKNHIKQNSFNPQILRRDRSFNQDDLKDNNIQRSNLRSVTQNIQKNNTQKNRQQRQNFTYIEQNKKDETQNDFLPQQIQNKYQQNVKQNNNIYNNLNKDKGKINDKIQQSKDNKKLSSNFQSLQIHEFNINNLSNYNQNQKLQDADNLGGQSNINLPYQFDCNERGVNMMVFSPISKESDKLINTPFSSLQQTQTKDTINKQKLLFSDDDQNSQRGNDKQQIYNQESKNQDVYYRDESSNENEQNVNTNQKINKNLQYNNKQLNVQQNNQFDNKELSTPFQFEFKLNKQQNNNNKEKNQYFGNSQIDLNQQTKNNTQSQQDLFISILEKADSNHIQSQSENENQGQQILNLHLGIPESMFSKINFKEIQNDNQKQSENSLESQFTQNNLIKQTSEKDKTECDEKQKQQKTPIESGADLIKFESCEDFSIITDYDKNNQVQKDENQTIPNQKNQIRYHDDGQQLFEDEQTSDNQNHQNQIQTQNNENPIQNINQYPISKNESHQYENQSDKSSKNSIEQQMNNDAEQLNKKCTLNKNQSVQKIMLIKEEEKKIRRAFRYQTTTSNKMEMLQTKKQFKIAEKVGVKIPYVKQLSSSRFKKQAQHLVMKKILNKKIQILVQTVMDRHNSEKVVATEQILTNEEQQNIKFFSQNQKNPLQFQQLMNTSSNSQINNTNKSQNEFKFYTFNQAFSVRSSSESKQIPDVKNCQSEYSNSPQDNQSGMNSQKFPSPIIQQQDPDYFLRKISFPKSKFSTNNEFKTPSLGQGQQYFGKGSPDNNPQSPNDNFGLIKNYSYNDNFQLDKPNQIQPQSSNEKDEQYFRIQDIINEDENESGMEYSEDQDLLNDSDDNIELQINRIYSSRLPNFQLMLYIERMIKKHKQKYQLGQELFECDDYQCYEEIEFQEKEKDNKDLGLDNSVDIPIDIIKPNFELDELFNLPTYLDSQISIMENKLSQIVEQTYEECQSCLDKIKKLAKIKEKKYLFIGTKDETDTNINQDNISHIQTRDHVNSVNQQKITISNLMNPSPQLINNKKFFKNSLQVDNSATNNNKDGESGQENQQDQNSQMNFGRVNLGHNIQFAMESEKNTPQKDEYNFFTELEKKNQILQQKNSSVISDPQLDQSFIPNIKSFCNTPNSRKHKQSNQFNEEEQKNQVYTPKLSDAIERSKLPKEHLKKSKFGELKVSSKETNAPPISEQQKIKNEFQKMFMNMRNHVGDRSPINMDMSSDFSSNFN